MMRPWLLKTRRVLRMPARYVTGETEPAAPPTLTSIDPDTGSVDGGDSVTITGTDFVDGATVTFGGSSATSVVVVSDTSITCVTPAHAAAAVDVVVTNPDAQSDTLASGFTYEDPVFNPATLDLTLWQRDYAGSPWTGTASAGTSGSNSFSEATNPPSVGTALNGHGTADYDGTNDILGQASGDASTYLTNTNGSGWVLFNADAASADAGAGSRQNNPQFLASNNGQFGIGFSSVGIHVYTVDGSNGQTEKVIACATGGWHLLQFKYSLGGGGLSLKLRLDNGAWQESTSAFGATLSGDMATSVLRSGGDSSNTSPFYNGRVADRAVSKLTISDGDFDNVRSYANARYGVSV